MWEIAVTCREESLGRVSASGKGGRVQRGRAMFVTRGKLGGGEVRRG